MHTAFTHTLAITRPTDHRLDPVLGRGASLDVGVYCVAPMLHAFGREPESVAAAATMHVPRTDRSLAGFLDFGQGASGAFDVSFEVPARQLLDVVGTEGRVTYLHAFNPQGAPTELELVRGDGEVETVAFDGTSAYLGMVDHVSDVIVRDVPVRFGRDGSLAVARTLDRLRSAAGVDSP
jgi:predicted dehydrogenase